MASSYACWEVNPDVFHYFFGSRETTLSDHACTYFTRISVFKFSILKTENLMTEIRLCCIRSYLPYTESFPRRSWEKEKGDFRRVTVAILVLAASYPNKSIKKPTSAVVVYLLQLTTK